MRRLSRIVAIAMLVVSFGPAVSLAQKNPFPPPEKSQEKTLYQRIGGYDMLAAIVDEVGSRVAADGQMRRFFLGHSQNSLARQRQLALDFLCDVSGGPCLYIGRDLKTTHGGLGISPADWDRFTGVLGETLVKFNIAERERKEFITLVSGLQKDIVEK